MGYSFPGSGRGYDPGKLNPIPPLNNAPELALVPSAPHGARSGEFASEPIAAGNNSPGSDDIRIHSPRVRRVTQSFSCSAVTPTGLNAACCDLALEPSRSIRLCDARALGRSTHAITALDGDIGHADRPDRWAIRAPCVIFRLGGNRAQAPRLSVRSGCLLPRLSLRAAKRPTGSGACSAS
jgi:hypothetical protein